MELSRRPFLWKLVAIVALALAVSAVALWLWIESVANRQWTEIERELHAIMTESDKRGGPRPTLNAEPGNAWDEYERALAELRNSGIERGLPERVIEEYGTLPYRAHLEDVFIRSRAAVEHLRSGVRKAEFRRPANWNPREAQESKVTANEIDLGVAALCAARELDESRAPALALDLVLDVSVFARDLASNGFVGHEVRGFQLLDRTLDEIRSLIAPRYNPTLKVANLDQTLASIEQGLPAQKVAALNTIAILGIGRSKNVPWNEMFGAVHIEGRGPRTPGWRFCYSMRLMEADAFRRSLEVARRYENVERLSWEEARKLEADAQNLVKVNGYTSMIRWQPVAVRRRIIAKLRILRMAAQYVESGEVRPLQDPFGDMLRHELIGTRLKVWSVGEDGVDDGGSGDWAGAAKDIVLKVYR